MSILQSTQLLDQLTTSIDASGWRYLLVQNRKPFRFRLFKDDESGFLDVRIYIWNCTHGGGAARATNEYRVRLTGVVPNIAQNETTIFLCHPVLFYNLPLMKQSIRLCWNFRRYMADFP